MRLIDADDFRNWLLKQNRLSKDYTIMMLDETPTIDPEKHGHWELCEDGLYKCTEEGCTQKANKYQRLLWDYCPKCGAKMWRGTDGKG